MSFRDEVAETLRQALEEKRSEEDAVTAFEREWQSLRASCVLPLLKEAAEALVEAIHQGRAGFVNGSVTLSTNSENQEHWLTFRPDSKAKMVSCASSFKDEQEEPFSLEGLTENVIKAKVQGFVYRVARGKKREEGSVYEGRGLLVV